jgi:hypothetical protein
MLLLQEVCDDQHQHSHLSGEIKTSYYATEGNKKKNRIGDSAWLVTSSLTPAVAGSYMVACLLAS